MLRSRRSGFSLIEALVVLAIGGMALAIIFNIGVKAGDTGFGLGRRAMAAADADIVVGDLRDIIQGLALTPPSMFREAYSVPVIGTSEKLEADVVMGRATQCAPVGWAGKLVLTIEKTESLVLLTCETDLNRTVLATLPASGEAYMSYSTDGQIWRSEYTNLDRDRQNYEHSRSERLWVRVHLSPTFDVVESAFSGPPDAWIRLDAEF